MSKKITRSTVNEQQYSAPEFPTSGFPLSYRRYMSGMLGRIHVNGFQFTMPGDKISGSSSGEFTFKRMVTPIVSPVNAMQYNIFLPFRPLDRSFKKGVTPTKLNGMSASWTMPMCNTRYLVQQLLMHYEYGITPSSFGNFGSLVGFINGMITFVINSGTSVTLNEFLESSGQGVVLYGLTPDTGVIDGLIHSLTDDNLPFVKEADALYCRDSLLDIAESISAKLGSIDSPISLSMTVSDFINVYLTCILEPWVGRYSYYGEFKYEFIRPFDIYRISRGLVKTSGGFLGMLSDTPQNEYPLRAMYAVWYELFRNVDLEPVCNALPDWQEWSSTSIFDMDAGGNLCYLLLRIRSWEKDMFISAQVDDLSRHVYAPVYADASAGVAYHEEKHNNYDTQSLEGGIPAQDPGAAGFRKPTIYSLGWRDQLSGEDRSILCPVPSNINDVLSALDNSFYDVYGLDLNTLRQSQALEKYLKRNYLFGDEYQDRMLAHYNSRVSDNRINKPEILSQSMDGYNMGQQVSNVSTDKSNVGDRTATATVKVNGNEYSTFCEEFGIVLSLVCFMPRAMYDGTTPQLYMSKQVHLPLPEFATNNEEFGRKSEIAGSGLVSGYQGDDQNTQFIFGRYPAYHSWRSRVDEVGGEFLDELQDSTFRRFFGMFSSDTTPKLNYFFIHCRPNLNMFADNIMYDTQLYGDIVNTCYVERVLPTPVEVI